MCAIASTSTLPSASSKKNHPKRLSPCQKSARAWQKLPRKRPRSESPNRKWHRGGIMIDLSTSYLGLQLRTPLVPSASPLSQEIDNIRRLEDAGASAVVLYSLFEEQLRQEEFELDHHLLSSTNSF